MRELLIFFSAHVPWQAGRMVDPLKAERKCAQLAKRMAICEASVDGQAKPSSTPDCELQRQRWRESCTNVRVHELREVDPDARTQTITQAYRQAAQDAADQPPAEPRGGALIRWLAEGLVARCERDGMAWRVAHAIGSYPAPAIVVLSGGASALLLRREAAKPSSAGLTGAQRLMGARVYVQAAVVLTTAVVVTLSEVVQWVDLSSRR